MEPFSKAEFYKHFKFGIEFEMETTRQARSNAGNMGYNMIAFINDGSIKQTKENSFCTELISSHPITKEEEETQFFEEMERVIGSFKSESDEDIFAYRNPSCGTHFHWSFKEKEDKFLYIFDCIDFEKFFFTKYMDTFKSEKFLSRINTKYCQARNLKSAEGNNTKPHKIKGDLNKLSLIDFQHETNGERYRWLNMKSVQEGTGAEVRVFPFLQTYAGAKQTTKFMQEVIYEYYMLPKTQEKLELIEIYEKYIQNEEFKIHKLSELKRIVYSVITQYHQSYGLSGEAKMFLASWVLKQPSLIKKEKAI